jgi:hypothetical protein
MPSRKNRNVHTSHHPPTYDNDDSNSLFHLFEGDVHTSTVQVENDVGREIEEQDIIDIDGTLAREGFGCYC